MPRRDLALDRQPAAEGEHADLAERRDRLQRRLVPRLEPHGADPRPVEAARRRRRGWSSSRSSWPKPFTTRTPLTASSTTPATSPARCCASQLRREHRSCAAAATRSAAAGTTASATSVSSGDRTSITTSDSDEQHDVAGHDRQEREQALDEAEVGARPATRAGRSAAGRGGRSRGVAGCSKIAVRRSYCTSRRPARRRSGGRRRRRSAPRPADEQQRATAPAAGSA